ncbi:MAG: YdcF family protein [Candidatus Omnitrophica bacterium]|nr:YdcF family protein [Candidatus Omnitrophota bacterium]
MRKKLKKILILVVSVLVIGGACAIPLSRYLIRKAANNKTYVNLNSVPKNKVGLVLGCARYLRDGRENLFFKYRMQAARELYVNGKVDFLLVSGDNHREGYDEPADMKDALIELGIPDDKIICDYAGFSTLDSVVRAKEVFCEDRIIVISQAFHNQRAIFIGKNRGVNIVGYNAKKVNTFQSFKTKFREELARVKTVLDIFIFSRQPKYFGKPVIIGDNT